MAVPFGAGSKPNRSRANVLPPKLVPWGKGREGGLLKGRSTSKPSVAQRAGGIMIIVVFVVGTVFFFLLKSCSPQ